ncbi:hypothetical protein [Streptomyces sp. FH025]
MRIERDGTSMVIEGGSTEEVLRIVAALEPPAGGTERP